MAELFIPAQKFQELLNYLQLMGADTAHVCEQVELDRQAIMQSPADTPIPALHYSRLYLQSVEFMEKQHAAIPWASGMGSRSFRLMCQCLISCKTLGDALQRGAEFCELTAPLFGHVITLSTEDTKRRTVKLAYNFDSPKARNILSPAGWERGKQFDATCLSSGLRAWNSITGWLIGRRVEVVSATVAAPSISGEHQEMLELTFDCPVSFGGNETTLEITASELQHPVIQDAQSLEQFLGHVLYPFWITDQSGMATTNAIKSMIGDMEVNEMPKFTDIARRLHMSPSTLRRRLLQENTSYQEIKDECRENSAIKLLAENHININEIADRLGFAETSSFIRAFRKWTGMTPRAYRDNSLAFSAHHARA